MRFKLFGARLEQRKSRRHDVIHTAWVRTADDPVPTVGVIWNVSRGGARLSVANPEAMPTNLTITLKREEPVGTKCRIVWRNSEQIGIEFVGNPEPILDLIKQTAASKN